MATREMAQIIAAKAIDAVLIVNGVGWILARVNGEPGTNYVLGLILAAVTYLTMFLSLRYLDHYECGDGADSHRKYSNIFMRLSVLLWLASLISFVLGM